MDKNLHTMDNNNMRISSLPGARTIIEVKENVQGKDSLESDDLVRNSKSLDFLNKKYKIMNIELDVSRSRINELEQSLVVRRTNNDERSQKPDRDCLYSQQEQNNNIMDNNRVMYLEEREKHLVKETHELREQNELLEFRILELEENQDKVGLTHI